MAADDFSYDEFSVPFQRAVELIRDEPWPSNIEDELVRLERRVPAHEKRHFGDLWEMYTAMRTDL